MQHTELLVLSWAALTVGIAASVAVAVDNLTLGYRQPVRVMELVWPVSAFYGGPAAVVAYWKWGRPQSLRWRQRHGHPPGRGRPVIVLIQLCHGGTHCALGTIIVEAAIVAIGIDVAPGERWVEYTCAYFAAVAVGVVFRYSGEVQRGRRRLWAAITAFARIDLGCVSAFELALFVWLVLADRFIVSGATVRPRSPVFWCLTQLGLIIGFVAAWPPTWWLHRRGVQREPPDVLS